MLRAKIRTARRDIGLGGFPAVTPSQARDKARGHLGKTRLACRTGHGLGCTGRCEGRSVAHRERQRPCGLMHPQHWQTLETDRKSKSPPATPPTFLNVPQFDTHPDDAPIQPDVRHFGPQKIEVLAPKFEDLSYFCDLYSDDISATAGLPTLI